jgi:hypothetical protein
MRGALSAFWLGVGFAWAVFAATGGTAVDLRVVAAGAGGARLEQDIDQSALAGLLAPAAPVIGVLHIKKRSWGLVTTYAETLAAPGARAAGAPDVRVLLTAPGSVTDTNAPSREGRALVWTGLPGVEPAWAESRAVNGPAAVFVAAAAVVSLYFRARGKAR